MEIKSDQIKRSSLTFESNRKGRGGNRGGGVRSYVRAPVLLLFAELKQAISYHRIIPPHTPLRSSLPPPPSPSSHTIDRSIRTSLSFVPLEWWLAAPPSCVWSDRQGQGDCECACQLLFLDRPIPPRSKLFGDSHFARSRQHTILCVDGFAHTPDLTTRTDSFHTLAHIHTYTGRRAGVCVNPSIDRTIRQQQQQWQQSEGGNHHHHDHAWPCLRSLPSSLSPLARSHSSRHHH